MSNLAIRELVDQAEKELLSLPQSEASVTYHFAPGLCIREIVMPAGSFAIGNYQKFDHLNVFLAGKVRMLQDDGTYQDMQAPMMYVGKPGRKVGYIVEDVVWQNIYATDETDADKIEAHFISVSEYAESFLAENRLLLTNNGDEYLNMLADLGYTQDMVDAECLKEDDLIPFPFGSYRVAVGKSPIHGKGLMVTGDMDAGCLIPANIGGKRTPAGRYTNHSDKPNAEPMRLHGDLFFRTLVQLSGNVGAVAQNEITVDYRAVFAAMRDE